MLTCTSTTWRHCSKNTIFSYNIKRCCKQVAGYEVVWRKTTDAQWTHARLVEGITELTLPQSKDDWQFGVRAVDRDGFRSPVRFAADGVR